MISVRSSSHETYIAAYLQLHLVLRKQFELLYCRRSCRSDVFGLQARPRHTLDTPGLRNIASDEGIKLRMFVYRQMITLIRAFSAGWQPCQTAAEEQPQHKQQAYPIHPAT